jgi:hypothetical protein
MRQVSFKIGSLLGLPSMPVFMLVLSVASALSLTSPHAAAQEGSTSLSSSPSSSSAIATEFPKAKDQKGPSNAHVELSLSIMSRSLEDQFVNSKYSGAGVELFAKRTFNETLSARLGISLLLATGTYSNQYSNEGAAPSDFSLDEAAMIVTPHKLISFEGGVLPTKFASVPSLMDDIGYPGLRATSHFDLESNQIEIFAMEALPVSKTAAVKPADPGVTSTLTLAGIRASTNTGGKDPVTVRGGLTRFHFSGLGASSATDSQNLGNTIVAPGPQARFVYGFSGYEIGAEASYRIRNVTLKTSGAFIRNELAPNEKNRGYIYSGGTSIALGQIEFAGSLGYFYNESDTLPACYAASGRGSNNRFGQFAQITITDNQEHLSGFVKYTHANEIEDRPYTADRDIIWLGLEATHDLL